MKYRQGFTIVEVAVVIVILAILTGLTIAAYNRVQAGARNDSAKSKTTIIAAALEKYYTTTGSYPSDCTALQGNIDTVTTAYLPGAEPTVLVRTGSSTPTQSSINCSATADTTTFSYTGNADSFTLKYMEEYTGTTVTLTSIPH